jgi:hypothetical protein
LTSIFLLSSFITSPSHISVAIRETQAAIVPAGVEHHIKPGLYGSKPFSAVHDWLPAAAQCADAGQHASPFRSILPSSLLAYIHEQYILSSNISDPTIQG